MMLSPVALDCRQGAPFAPVSRLQKVGLLHLYYGKAIGLLRELGLLREFC
jgi:hypothetical protein